MLMQMRMRLPPMQTTQSLNFSSLTPFLNAQIYKRSNKPSLSNRRTI